MSDVNCGIPNVDIFDPVQCTKRWSQCATQQQINVYLNAEIVRTQECLQLFKTAQQGVNDILDGKIRNHETRIAALESAEKDLKAAQDSLTQQFKEIQAGNTAYQTSVDNTLKLYQSSINALTTTTNTLTSEQQKMWNEINALKGSVDITKINQAIAGYDAIMSQTTALIEQHKAETDVKLKQLDTKFNTLESDTQNAISESESKISKRFSDFAATVSGDIEAQNSRLNTFINTTTQSITNLQSEVSELQVAVEKAETGNAAEFQKVRDEFKAADCVIEQRIAAEEQARKDGDSRLEGIIKTNEKESKDSISKLEESVKADINTFEQNVDSKLLQINNDIRDRTDKQIDGLDEKLSARINSLEITEKANNATTNGRIDALEKEVAGGVDDRISAAAATINARITKVESDAQTDNANLEAKLTKQISDGAAQQASDLSDLKALVDTQGELITASRDESTLAWKTEVQDRKDGDAALQAQIDGLKDTVKENDDAASKALVEAIAGVNDHIDNEVKALNDRMDKVEESDAKQWTTINNTVESQNQLREQVDKMQETVDKVDTTQIDAIGEKVQELSDKVDAVDADAVTALEKRVETNEEDIATLKAQGEATVIRQGEIDGRLKIVEAADVKTEDRLKALEEASDSEGYDDTQLRSELSGVKVAADTNTNSINLLDGRVSVLERQDISKMPSTVNAVSAAGENGAQFLDASKQAVRISLTTEKKISFAYSSLHHKCIVTMHGTAKECQQNGSLAITGNGGTFALYPLKEGYAVYEGSFFVDGSTLYSTMTQKPL